MLAFLGLCALTAPAASAVPPARMYTCEGGGTLGFTDSHCIAGSTGPYHHVVVPINTTTYHGIAQSNTCTEETACPTTIKGTLSGVTVSIQAAAVTGTGTIVSEESGGEAFTTGTEILYLEEAKVIAPAGKGCVISGGEIVSNELRTTTLGAGGLIKLEPASGTTLASIAIEGCSIGALNNTFSLTGSVEGSPTGAILGFTHTETTGQGTLKLGGTKAGLDTNLTTSGKDWFFESWSPLSFTQP
ncbi:MAG: hypothetical protein AB7V58_08685 [Solirubrobacterales bacterium]